MLAGYIQYNYIFLKMYIPQLCARRAHRNPPTYIYPQIVGMLYPMQIYIFKNVHSLTLCLKGTQKPSNLHSSPKCWHDISNINIYIQLTYIPQTVGSIYPIQIYISKKVHSPNSKLHLSPKCWHDISNTNTHIGLTYIPQIVGSTYPMQIYIFKNVHSLTLWFSSFFIVFGMTYQISTSVLH